MSGASDLWSNFGFYGADGVKGAEALAIELNRIVYTSGIKSGPDTPRGVKARLNYLNSPTGREEMRRQGITDRALKSWQSKKSTPSRENRERLESAYWNRRRENLVRSGQLKRVLNNAGHGRTVEIYPVNQANVSPERVRALEQRELQVRYVWDDAVDAWAEKDLQTLDEIWEDIIAEMDSDLSAYAYVSAIGISA